MPAASALQSQFAKVAWSVRYRGVPATMLSCAAKALRINKLPWYTDFIDHQFDRRHGIDTGGVVPTDCLDVSPEDQRRAVEYMPTQPVEFATLLSAPGRNYDGYTFIDFGSGKGRSMIMATAFPFRRIVGLEFSDNLCQQARGNIDRWQVNPASRRAKCRDLKVVNANAIDFELPPGPAALYFFNPFNAEVMRPVLDNIERSFRADPRPLVLVYSNPVHYDLWEAAGFLNQVAFFEDKPRGAVYVACGEQT